MKMKIYKLLSIEHKNTKEDKKEAEQILKLIKSIKGIKLKNTGRVGGEIKL